MPLLHVGLEVASQAYLLFSVGTCTSAILPSSGLLLSCTGSIPYFIGLQGHYYRNESSLMAGGREEQERTHAFR